MSEIRNMSTKMIKDEITQLESRIEELRIGLKQAELAECKVALDAFVDRFRLNSIDRIDRASDILVRANFLGNESEPAKKIAPVSEPVPEPAVVPAPEPVPVVTKHVEIFQVNSHKEEPEAEPEPVAPAPVPEPVIEEKAEEAVQKDAPPVPEEEPKESADADWDSLFSDLMGDLEAPVEAEKPEEVRAEEPEVQQPVEDAPSVEEPAPEEHAEPEEAEEPEEVSEDADQDDLLDMSFTDLLMPDVSFEEDEAPQAKPDMKEMGNIFDNQDNDSFNANAIIAVEEDDPVLMGYKKKSAIVNAESSLVNAIVEGVKEGWVAKEDVISRFFKGEIAAGTSEKDRYKIAGEIADDLESSFASDELSESYRYYSQFARFPYQVRCRAIQLARHDIEAVL